MRRELEFTCSQRDRKSFRIDTPTHVGQRYSAAYARDQARIVLGMVRQHLAAERARFGPAERRCILARRYARLGRNLVTAGARGRGAALIL